MSLKPSPKQNRKSKDKPATKTRVMKEPGDAFPVTAQQFETQLYRMRSTAEPTHITLASGTINKY